MTAWSEIRTGLIYLQIGQSFQKRFFGDHPEDVSVSNVIKLIYPESGQVKIIKTKNLKTHFKNV